MATYTSGYNDHEYILKSLHLSIIVKVFGFSVPQLLTNECSVIKFSDRKIIERQFVPTFVKHLVP